MAVTRKSLAFRCDIVLVPNLIECVRRDLKKINGVLLKYLDKKATIERDVADLVNRKQITGEEKKTLTLISFALEWHNRQFDDIIIKLSELEKK